MDFKCPKCGTTSGYVTRRKVTLETWYSFDHEVQHTETDRDRDQREKIKKCADCGKDITKFVDSLPKND